MTFAYGVILFIPRHFKKCGVSCYTLNSKKCVRVSVFLSVRPSASADPEGGGGGGQGVSIGNKQLDPPGKS